MTYHFLIRLPFYFENKYIILYCETMINADMYRFKTITSTWLQKLYGSTFIRWCIWEPQMSPYWMPSNNSCFSNNMKDKISVKQEIKTSAYLKSGNDLKLKREMSIENKIIYSSLITLSCHRHHTENVYHHRERIVLFSGCVGKLRIPFYMPFTYYLGTNN